MIKGYHYVWVIYNKISLKYIRNGSRTAYFRSEQHAIFFMQDYDLSIAKYAVLETLRTTRKGKSIRYVNWA